MHVLKAYVPIRFPDQRHRSQNRFQTELKILLRTMLEAAVSQSMLATRRNCISSLAPAASVAGAHPGICIIRDDGQDLAPRMMAAQRMIWLTPSLMVAIPPS